MSPETIVALVGFSGAILGATVGGVATSLTERWKYKVATRTEAYKALIDAMSKLTIFNGAVGNDGTRRLSPAQQAALVDLFTEYRAAKTRVALYGSPAVLTTLATFSSQHARMADDSDAEAYISILETMRRDSFARDYGAFRTDIDNLMVRGEVQQGPDGKMMTARERAAAAGPADGPAPAQPAPAQPDTLHGSFSFPGKTST